jgi:hypothetical protein
MYMLLDSHNTMLPQTSDAGSDIESRASLADKVDALSSRGSAEGRTGLKSLVKEFTPVEQTSSALNSDLAELVNGLINDKLPKDKLAQLQEKYLRPQT